MPLPSTKNNGFTLIEILISLAILAIALSALMGSTNTIAHNGIALQERTLAAWVAEDVMNEFRITNQWPAPGTRDGSRKLAGQQWSWKLNIEETKEQSIFKTTIDVYRPGEDEQVLSTLTSYFALYERSSKTFGSKQ
jgi:general secretion pathway protein I